jgi:hypothetical protein
MYVASCVLRSANPCGEIFVAILILRRNSLDCKPTVLPCKKLCVDELAENKERKKET